jgi:hypothetical protein
MTEEIKKLVEEYQCPGCVNGCDISCYENKSDEHQGCERHVAGTRGDFIGLVFLGMPIGFNRLGISEKTVIRIYENFDPEYYNKFNVPVWKHLDKNGNTLVRGIMPRVNEPFIHIWKGDHIKEINCLEITEKEIEEME